MSHQSQQRTNLMASLSRQFDQIRARMNEDIDRQADSTVGGIGFVLYHLKDLEGEPLKDTLLAHVGVSMPEVESLEGYEALSRQARRRNCTVRLDQHFFSSEPEAIRLIRVVIDGWRRERPVC